jgi:hypothetical protein
MRLKGQELRDLMFELKGQPGFKGRTNSPGFPTNAALRAEIRRLSGLAPVAEEAGPARGRPKKVEGQMTKAELADALRALGLKVSGTLAELLERYNAAVARGAPKTPTGRGKVRGGARSIPTEAEVGPLIGFARGDPRNRLNVSGPTRFANQGSLGYYGEMKQAAPQPALMNNFRQGMMAPEAPTAAAYRNPSAPSGISSSALARQSAIDRADMPMGDELPAATLASREGATGALGNPRGGKKNWMADVMGKIKKGAFTKQAKAQGKTTKEFAKDVLAHPEKHTAKTEKRAVLAQTLAKASKGGMKSTFTAVKPTFTTVKGRGRPAKGPVFLNGAGKRHKGAFHKMPDGTYMTGKTHNARSKPLTLA